VRRTSLPHARRPVPARRPSLFVAVAAAPAAAATVVRSDTAFAKYETRIQRRLHSRLDASRQLQGTWHRGQVGRARAPGSASQFVNDSPPSSVTAGGGFAFVNPLLGATYAVPLGAGVRAAFFLAAPSRSAWAAETRRTKDWSTHVRQPGRTSQMDNSLFRGQRLCAHSRRGRPWWARGSPCSGGDTIPALAVRGEKAQQEASKTNFTFRRSRGYFFVPELSWDSTCATSAGSTPRSRSTRTPPGPESTLDRRDRTRSISRSAAA